MNLCGAISSSYGEKLQCEFLEMNNFGITLYSCFVLSLENPNDDKIMTGYNGSHQLTKSDIDVKEIYIYGKEIEFIPANLGSLFHLTAFAMLETKLIEISFKDFQGMENLERLNLRNNKLTHLSSNAFTNELSLKLEPFHFYSLF